MNIQGILSVLGLDSSSFIAGINEASDATDKFTQEVANSATAAGQELQAISDKLAAIFSQKGAEVSAANPLVSVGDWNDAVQAGLITSDKGFRELGKTFEDFQNKVSGSGKKIADDSKKASDDFVGNFTKGINILKNSFAAFAASLPFIMVIKESTEAIFGFDAALVDMQAHTLLTAEVIQRLGEYASFATDSLSQFHELDAVAGLQVLARAGQDVVTAMGNLPAVLDLAAVAGMDVASAADTVATTMNQFGMSVMDATRVADVYTKASQMSTASTQELASMMRYMAATMSGAGYSFEETTAYVTAFINAGMMARQASGALSTAVETLAHTTTEGDEVLKQYGVSVRDAAGKVRPLIDVVLELKKAGASTTDMLTVFGSSSQKITTVLATLGKEGFGKLVSGLKDSKGAAEAAAGVLQTSLASSLDNAHKSINDIWLSLGKDLKPVLQWFMAAINGLLNLVKNAVQSIEGWSMAQKVLVGTFVGLSATIIPIIKLIDTFKTAAGLLSLTMRTLGASTTVAMGPLALIALAVAAVTAVVLAGITAWKDYKNTMDFIVKGLPSTENLIGLRAKLAQFDKDTANGVGGTAIDLSTGLRTWSDAEFKDRAQRRVVLEKQISDQISGIKGAAQNEEANRIKVNLDNQKAAANETKRIAKELSDAIYTLKHTEYQNSLKAINEQTAAFIKTGVEGGKTLAQATIDANVFKAAAIAKLDKDTAASSAKLSDAAAKKDKTASDAALKKAQETADAIVAAQLAASDALDRITMDTTQYALKQLKTLMAEWKANGVKEVTIAAYSAQQKKIIWGDYNREVQRMAEETAQKEADLLQEAQDNATAGVEAMQAEIAAHVQKAADAWEEYNGSLKDYNDSQKDLQSSLSDFLKEQYQEEYNAKKDSLDNNLRIAQEAYKTEEDAVNNTYDFFSKGLDTFRKNVQEFYKDEEQDANDLYDSKSTALDNSLKDAKDAYKAEEQAVNDRYDAEMSALDILTNAKLEVIDAKLTELDANKQAGKDVIDQASLEHDLVYATTRQERDAIIAKIAALKGEIAYRAAVNVLDKERVTIQDAAKVESTRLRESQRTAILDIQTRSEATQTAYDNDVIGIKEVQRVTLLDIETRSKAAIAGIDVIALRLKEDQRTGLLDIKERSIATQVAYDTDTKTLDTFYYNKMLRRNTDAEAEKMLQTQTHGQIMTMMDGQLSDFASKGRAAGDAWWNAYQGVIAGLAATPPVSPPTYAPPVGGGGGIAMKSFESGGWAGLHGVETVRVGEAGPEYISAEGPSKSGVSETLLRGIIAKLETLTVVTRSVAPGVGRVINSI